MPKITYFFNSKSVVLASYEAFLSAIESGNINILNTLNFTDAHLAVRNYANYTPLHIAIAKCNETLIHWLLEQGADVNLVDDLGDTPLHLAIIMRAENIVERLLMSGKVNIYIKNIYGQTVLDLANSLNDFRIANLLTRKNSLTLSATYFPQSKYLHNKRISSMPDMTDVPVETTPYQVTSINNTANNITKNNYSPSKKLPFFQQPINSNDSLAMAAQDEYPTVVKNPQTPFPDQNEYSHSNFLYYKYE